MDRGGYPSPACRFDLGAEGNEQAAARGASGVDVVTFDPVIDDVRADAQDGGDLGDGELVGGLGFGGVRGMDVSRPGHPVSARSFDLGAERDAPLVVEAATRRQPAPGDPVDDRAVADAEAAGHLGDGELAVFEQAGLGDLLVVAQVGDGHTLSKRRPAPVV